MQNDKVVENKNLESYPWEKKMTNEYHGLEQRSMY